MANNYTQIVAKNSLLTNLQPIYTLSIYQGGYLAQQASIRLSNNSAVVLGCSVGMSNRTVSMSTTMTITCDRNSDNWELGDQLMLIYLPANAFNYTMAYDASSQSLNSANPKVTVPITAGSPRLITTIVSNLTNPSYIPTANNLDSIVVNTVSSAGNIVGNASISPSLYLVNDAYDVLNVSASRSGTVSGGYTNISINYSTQLGTSSSIMLISLPYGQNTFVNTISNCFIMSGSNSQQLCHILSFNATDIAITYVPNATVLLTSLLNSYPNANLLRVQILTASSQLIEEGYAKVLPIISLWRINMTATASSNKVADVSYLSLQLVPTQLRIDNNNIVRIDVPTKMYTRTLNKDDCIMKYNGSTYQGCTYGYDSEGWLRNITLSNIGPAGIDINTTLNINVSVTNAWAPYLFAGNAITVTINIDAATSVSQGTLTLV